MNQAKLDKTIRGLTTVSRKVLECVPKEDAWTANQVIQELKRTGQMGNPNLRTVAGCLASLIENGLVVEPKNGLFRQVTVGNPANTSTPRTVVDHNPTLDAPVPEAPKHTDALPRLTAMVGRMALMAREFSSLADEAEIIVLEIEESFERDAEYRSQFKQLQVLLSSIASKQ